MSDARPAAGPLALLLTGAVAIGFAPIFAKLAMDHGEIGPSAAAFWRVFVALPVFVLLLAIRRPLPAPDGPRLHPAWLLVPGLLFAGDLAAWHGSLLYTTAAISTLLANLQAVIVGVVGWLFLRERVNVQFGIGGALALTGVAGVLFLDADASAPGANPLLGDGLAILTAVFYASYLITMKSLRRRWSVAVLMSWSCAAAAPVLLACAFLAGERIMPTTAAGWWSIIAMALVAHCLGQGLIIASLARLPASFSAVTLLIQPLAVVVLGWLMLEQALTGSQLFAGAVVLVGIYLARRAIT